MDCLPASLKCIISKLSDNQREEIDIIESILNVNETNMDIMKEKLINYTKKHPIDDCICFIIQCIILKANIRVKERRYCVSFINMLINDFNIKPTKILTFNDIWKIMDKNECAKYHTIDFAEEGSVPKAIFDDDINKFQELFNSLPDELMNYVDHFKKEFFLREFPLFSFEIEQINAAALFGSVNCFKFMMMNDIEITNNTCQYAVAGGNNEIIHLCEQKELKFTDCLEVAIEFHHFDIYEWLTMHFEYEEVSPRTHISSMNEPLFYSYISKNPEFQKDKNIDMNYIIDRVSEKGLLEIAKHLNGKGLQVDSIDMERHNPVFNASMFGHIEILKYFIEAFHTNVETKDYFKRTLINIASENGNLNIVKYLYETFHANIEAEDIYGNTPILNAIKMNRIDVVKYLYETCHAEIDIKNKDERTPINIAAYYDSIDSFKYLYEVCHDNFETKDNNGYDPLKNSVRGAGSRVFKYLYEECHLNIDTKESNILNIMMSATNGGNHAMVKYLFEKFHPNIELKDEYGDTIIKAAIEFKRTSVVKCLVEECNVQIRPEDVYKYILPNERSLTWHGKIYYYLRKREKQTNI